MAEHGVRDLVVVFAASPCPALTVPLPGMPFCSTQNQRDAGDWYTYHSPVPPLDSGIQSWAGIGPVPVIMAYCQHWKCLRAPFPKGTFISPALGLLGLVPQSAEGSCLHSSVPKGTWDLCFLNHRPHVK